MAQADLIDAIGEQLVIFNNANAQGARLFRQFLAAAQGFDFVAAGDFQLATSANMDAAMDAFMTCCRLCQRAKDG